MRAAALWLCLLTATTVEAKEVAIEGTAAKALFERLQALEGEWVAVGDDGKPNAEVQLVYRTVAGGHAVMSTEFPGTEHEMITVYHLEGEAVAMTHYCVLGNRPNMVARSYHDGVVVFECRGRSALDREKAKHMHRGTIDLSAPDEMTSAWILHDGGEAVHTAEFHVVRRRDF